MPKKKEKKAIYIVTQQKIKKASKEKVVPAAEVKVKVADEKTHSGACPACARTLEIIGGRGRCECGQAVMARFGRLVRIKETPAGCIKQLAAAKTLSAPAPQPASDGKAKAKRASGKMSGLDAAAKVLEESNEPLGCDEIMKRVFERQLWTTNGKTPAATIYSAIIREIAKGSASRFRKTERGKFEFAR